jgi:hypothetical protein
MRVRKELMCVMAESDNDWLVVIMSKSLACEKRNVIHCVRDADANRIKEIALLQGLFLKIQIQSHTHIYSIC